MNSYLQFSELNLGDGTGKLLDIASFGDLFVYITRIVFILGLSTSILFIIICGIKFATSAGDQQKTKEARECIMYAVVGAIVIIGFRVIANLVLTTIGTSNLENSLNP